MAKRSTKNSTKKIEDVVEVVETTDAQDVVDDVEAQAADTVDEIEETVDAADPVEDLELTAEELENTSSLSSKVLTGLVLMTVGGGLALWGGPKIAPMLPAGMAPVADFLAPGQASATQQVADLKAELNTKLAEMAADGASTDAITAAIADYDAQNSAKLSELRDQLAAVDGGDVESRLGTVETQLAGVSGELSSLSGQLSSVDLSGGNMDAASAAKIAGFTATIEGLKAEMAAMASQQGNLSQKIDEVSVSTARKVKEAAEQVAVIETQKEMTDLTTAIESGVGFQAALDALAANGTTIPDALSSTAELGVPTMTDLKANFATAAHTALKADARAQAADGVGGTVANFFKSQVTVRSLEPQEGDGANAVLSRVQGALDAGNLDEALTQADGLTGAAQSALADWVETAKSRASVLSAVETLSTSISQ